MSALLEGENNGSELEPLISEPNKTFVVIFCSLFCSLFSYLPQQDPYNYRKLSEVAADLSY